MNREKRSVISRRDMLKAAAAGGLLAGLRTGAAWAKDAAGASKPGIALQIYSLRDEARKDFDKTLVEVQKLGFTAVELTGSAHYRNDPKGFRKRLDDLGLAAVSIHIHASGFTGDALSQAIDFHKTIGCKYLIVPGDPRFIDPEGSKELAEILNKTAEELKKVDMYCGYHNHVREFQKLDGVTYWDLFAQRTSPSVVLEQDIGWTTAAGEDPAALVRKYPGRSKIVHCKPAVVGDKGRPIIGEDSVKWPEALTACIEVGGTEWFTIEQEKYLPDATPIECVKQSLAGLKKILANL